VKEVPFSLGDRLTARPVSGRQNQVYIKVGGKVFSVLARCLQNTESSVQTKHRKKNENDRKKHQKKSDFYLALGGVTWSESIALVSSASGSHPIYVSSHGATFGAGTLLSLGQSIDLSFELAGLLLRSSASSVSPTGTVNPEFNYELSAPASVWGGRFQPGIAWHTSNRGLSLGIAFPMTYRIGNWPTPSAETDSNGTVTSYTMNGARAFKLGAVVESKIRFGRFLIMPRGGLYGSNGDLLIDMTLGYSF